MKSYHIFLIGFVLLIFTGALMKLEHNHASKYVLIVGLFSLVISVILYLLKQRKKENNLV